MHHGEVRWPDERSAIDGDLRSVFEQLADAIRGLGTLAQPVIDATAINDQALLAARGNRIEKSNLLDVTAVACTATVGHYDGIERPLLGATT